MGRETEAELIVRLEGLTLEAEKLAKAAGLGLSEWLGRMSAEERKRWGGVEEFAAIWERVEREMREHDAWMRALAKDPRKEGRDLFCYGFLDYAEAQIREQGIPLDEPKAVDCFFDQILPKHKGTTHDGRLWYNRPLESNMAIKDAELGCDTIGR